MAKSEDKYWDAHLLAQAAQNSVLGSATRRGLWNAFTKKRVVADAMDEIEKEKDKRQDNKDEVQ